MKRRPISTTVNDLLAAQQQLARLRNMRRMSQPSMYREIDRICALQVAEHQRCYAALAKVSAANDELMSPAA